MQTDSADGAAKTVLHVIDNLSYAGAQQYIVLLCRWSPPRKYRHIVCVLQPNPALREQVEAAGGKVVCLNMARPSIRHLGRIISYAVRATSEIIRLCRAEGVGVVQCHLSDGEFLGITAAALAKVPNIITTAHGPLPLLPNRPWWSARNVLRRIATWLLYIRVDHIVAVSAEVAAEVRRLFGASPGKITTLINRIDTNSYDHPADDRRLRASLGIAPEGRVITMIARLVPHKGQTILLEAMHLLAAHHQEAQLLLVGDGESRPILEKQCYRLGITDRVRFLGNRDDVREVLAATDIFAFSSLAEGTSLALMEAMAAGKPIVATDIPGNRSLLTDGKSAMLVPPGDVKALAEALAALLENPLAAKNYGAEARAFVREHFDIRTTIAGLERLWQFGRD